MAPRGTKTQTSARREAKGGSQTAKASSRGGIQKRRGGPARIDTDGDLDMGSAASRRSAQTTTRDSNASRARPGLRSANPRGASKAAQTVLKHLANGETSGLASRISNAAAGRHTKSRPNNTSLSFLRVHGLKESKAASNPDGGLSDLLAFLERKASSFTTGREKRQVTIKKVCPMSTNNWCLRCRALPATPT
jgi:nuclear RNA export factor